ncbi:peptidase S41 [Bacteroidia bacterium]|nr:peptidase S41 [Bacteroidia bacterium]
MHYFMSRKISLALVVLGSLTLFSSCEEHDFIDEEIRRNQNVNDWILENMEAWYLWSDNLPVKTDKNLEPGEYFESLLYRGDRFSWIQENFIELLESLSGVQLEAGYDFTLGRSDDNSLVGLINYVKPNSPASQAGLNRGDFFVTINGAQLSTNNDDLLNALSANHTLGIITQNTIREVSLSVVKYEENPIFLDTVYEISNKKIGYLIYNFFAQDNGNNSLAYVKELNQVFGKFQEQSINELILDLRYNSGGAMSTSVALSSMIANRPSSDLFGKEEYNSLLDSYLRETGGANYNKTFFQDQIEKYDGNGIVLERVAMNKLTGLNRIYVLTSNRTASASELVINGLQPYMNVVLIGTTTVGKNVGSVTLYEKDPQKQKNNTWGMQPIVVKLMNADNSSDYSNGFLPDVKVVEYQELPLFLPLGDTEEVMLRTALIHIGVRAELSPENNNLRIEKTAPFSFRPVISTIDLTPARRNVFLD